MSSIRYLKPLIDDVFNANFVNCHFDENVFLPLEGDKSIPKEWQDITWNVSSLSHPNPYTRQCELKVQRIVHFQRLENQLPNVFTNTKKVTKSLMSIVNTPTLIDIPLRKLENVMASKSKTHLKHDKPISSKDIIPKKKKTINNI